MRAELIDAGSGADLSYASIQERAAELGKAAK
jgi:hypothetical protein